MKRLQTNVGICLENYELGKKKLDKLKLDAEMWNVLTKRSREYSKFWSVEMMTEIESNPSGIHEVIILIFPGQLDQSSLLHAQHD